MLRLKLESDQDILAHGGAGFARSLVRLGLVDEYRLVVPDLPQPLHLELVSAAQFRKGAVGLVYRPVSA